MMLRSWTMLGVLAALAAGAGRAEQAPVPSPPVLDAKSYFLFDSASGRTIAESRAEKRVEPASLTKLMTAYVVFEALRDGRIRLEDPVYVSEKAWRTGGSRMFIEVDTRVGLEDLLHGMIIQSGNDASVALAEHVADSVEAFVALMNQAAAKLGMAGTSYRNPTGLHADGHYTTARDTAMLAHAVITEFPDYYHLYSEREFTYNDITQHNRNALLWRDPSVDGMKTGYTSSAGYCLATSAERGGMRLIAVVMGMPSADARSDGGEALLNYGFASFETHKLYSAGEKITAAQVWKGRETAPLGFERDLFVTIPRGRYADLSATMSLPQRLIAPLQQRARVGEVTVQLGGEVLSKVPLVVLQQVPEAGFLARLADGVRLWFE